MCSDLSLCYVWERVRCAWLLRRCLGKSTQQSIHARSPWRISAARKETCLKQERPIFFSSRLPAISCPPRISLFLDFGPHTFVVISFFRDRKERKKEDAREPAGCLFCAAQEAEGRGAHGFRYKATQERRKRPLCAFCGIFSCTYTAPSVLLECYAENPSQQSSLKEEIALPPHFCSPLFLVCLFYKQTVTTPRGVSRLVRGFVDSRIPTGLIEKLTAHSQKGRGACSDALLKARQHEGENHFLRYQREKRTRTR